MRWSCLSAAFIALLIHTPPAPAQTVKDALQVIPDDAAGFILLNRVGELRGKLESVGKRLKAPLDPKMILLGPEKGLNDKGTMAVALFTDAPKDPSIPIAYIPVSDYGAFISRLGGKEDGSISDVQVNTGIAVLKMVAAKRGSFALLTRPEGRAHLQRAMANEKGVAAWAAPLEDWLTENDVSAVATRKGQQMLAEMTRHTLAVFKKHLADAPAEAQVVAGWLDDVSGFVKRVETDVTHLAAGGRIADKGDVQLSVRALFAKGSDFAKAGAASKALPGGPLAGLPAGPFALAMGGSMSEKVMQTFMGFSIKAMDATLKDLPRDKRQKWEQAMLEMNKGLRGMGMVVQVGDKADPLFKNMIGVIHVDNAKDYMERYQKNLHVMNEVLKGADPAAPLLQEIKQVKVNGVTALEMSMDATGGVPLGDEQKAIFEKMFGPGGKVAICLAPLGDNMVVFRYTRASELKELLGRKGGLAMQADIVKTAALLPEGSQWAVYVHPQGMSRVINQVVRNFAPEVTGVPDFPDSAPLGLGLKLAESGMEVRAVIPTAVLEALGDLLAPRRPEAE